MRCPYCGSQNIQTHVVKKDKQARNAWVAIIVVLLIFAIALLWAFLSHQPVWICTFFTFILFIPIVGIISIVLRLIPCGEKIIAICCDCGEEFDP